MKGKMQLIGLGLGWVFLAIFLMSGYYYNKLSNNSEKFSFTPITWDNHMQIFNGALQCNLISEDLLERKKILKATIFANVVSRKESLSGITYFFNDDADLLKSVMEQVQIEKACCPFMKFDIAILPFSKGFALQISGPEGTIELLKGFESEEL